MDKRCMKILYGGFGTAIQDHLFINYFLKKGHDIILVTFSSENTPNYHGFLTHERLTIYHFDTGKIQLPTRGRGSTINYLIETFINSIIFIFFVWKTRPDVINGHWTIKYGLYSALSAYKPFLLTAWGSDILIAPKNSPIIAKNVNKFVLKRADKVIVDSLIQETAVIEQGCSKEKIVRFPWAVKLEMFNPKVDGSKIRSDLKWENKQIIFSCRWHEPVYGIEYLIRAIPIIIKKNSNVRFLIGGVGTLTPKFKNMVKTFKVEEYVKFVGRISYDKMPEFLSACDIYVSTSFSDGTSATLLEAMACKKPVVVTDIPANREWITDQINGIIVPIQNEIALADGIGVLLDNRKLQQKMGTLNWDIVQEKADFQKGLAIYESTLKNLTK